MKTKDFSRFFTTQYWTEFFSRKDKPSAFGLRIGRVILAAGRGFNYDDCSTKASALTFYSLLSIVPVLAVAFAIAKGFGFERHLEMELQQKFLEQKEVSEKLFEYAHKMLLSAQGGVIGGVGVVVLLYTVIKLLGNIESSFNSIWKVQQARSFSRKFSDYLALIIFCPIFFVASSSLSVFFMTNLVDLTRSSSMLEMATPVVMFLFHLFPLLFSWLLFTGLYYIMPNARVPLRYAFLAGIIGGSAYQLVQWTYIKFQFGLSSYDAIYGSLAALPLFLIWINTSWLITLAGAEIAYHAETDRSHTRLYLASRQCIVDARILGLLIMNSCIRTFVKGETPPTEYSLSEDLGVPVIEVRKIVHQLIEAGLLVEVNLKTATGLHLHPGKSIDKISIKAVCNALDSARQTKYAVIHYSEVDYFEKTLAEADHLLEKSKKAQFVF